VTRILLLVADDDAAMRELVGRSARSALTDIEVVEAEKLELDRATSWLTREARVVVDDVVLDLVCAGCGYGVARAVPPDHCPMCRAAGEWLNRPLPSPSGLELA
jgi:rubrerythrin